MCRARTITVATTTASPRHHARSISRTESYAGTPDSDSSAVCRPCQSPIPVKTSAPVPAATNPGSSARPIALAGIWPPAAATSKMSNAATSGPPKRAAIAANAPASMSSCASVCADADEPARHDPQAEAERDERPLRPEHETGAERRQRGEEDASEVARLEPAQAEAFERRVPAVARQPERERDDHAGEARHEDDVPRGRLLPPEPFRHDLPDEVDDVVERGLEEHRRDCHRDPEQRRVDERAQVRPGFA